MTYRKIPKISPGANIFQRPFLRGLSKEGNLRFKIDWASLIVGRKFTKCNVNVNVAIERTNIHVLFT